MNLIGSAASFYFFRDYLGLVSIQPIGFKVEREMQNIIEANTEKLFGDKFLNSEFAVGNYRMDTVAYDDELKAFVILEYKNMTKSSVVDQGYSYLNTLLNHKADFVLLYNHVFDMNQSEEHFDWTQTKVIFVAKGFTQYQKDAVDNPELPIELYEVKKYANNYLTVNKIEKHAFAQTAHLSKPTKPLSGSKSIDDASAIAPYTEEDQLNNGSERTRLLYQQLRDGILSWDSSIEVKPTKFYLGFQDQNNRFVDFHIFKDRLKLWINLTHGELNDSLGISRDVSHVGHWGNGDYEIVVENDKNLEYILSLIKQGWIAKTNL
ncbi:DUF5655 domain-containing protein [Lentilactobacillus parabuchneri]|uniref:DUF5655 domain-containing protein n=2 Tax=Lentilactobacillus TaxID=2767893 RepID=UPI0031E3049D